MSLANTVSALAKRPLTPEETAALSEFQKHFSVDDEDPLLVVLAMMARSQLILEGTPALLEKRVNETIELHRTMLREQASIVSKDLISVIGHQLKIADGGWKKVWAKYAGFFLAGICVGMCLFYLAYRVLGR